MKLFKHIKNNNFKLNEEVNRTITKIEEEQALNYIRKVLIPVMVVLWNKKVSVSKTATKYSITNEQLSRNLKKIVVSRHNKEDKTTTDVIKYVSDFTFPDGVKLKTPFVIEVYKNVVDGKLTFNYQLPGENIYHTHDIQFINLKENEIYKPFIRPTISKMEEARALKLILSKLVPISIRKYNFKSERYGNTKITEQEARRLLRKYKVENFLNGQEIIYIIKLPLYDLFFRILKLSFRKDKGDREDKDIFNIGYYDITASSWGNLGWMDYSVENIDQELQQLLQFNGPID